MSDQVYVPNYITVVRLDQTTEEDYCYIAYHPELPNTLSQGDTPEEATGELAEATRMTIEYLTAEGLPIPQPRNLQSALGNGSEMQQDEAKAVLAKTKSTIGSAAKKVTMPSVYVNKSETKK